MADPNKDTIYIDIDDEITTIIEKVRNSDKKIVALVLPKRATVLQSIVNMKLLKRSAENEMKSLVLISSEAGLLPLAGAVGLYVAKTLQSKPEIPGTPLIDDADETAEEASLDDDDPEEITNETAGDRPVGELAGATAGAAVASDAIETISLDDEIEPDKAAGTGATAVAAASKLPKAKKNKKLAVPNFERFRLMLILGGALLILLIVGVVVAATVLPKASVTILTDTTNLNSSLNFTADTAAKQLQTDASKLVVPAKAQQIAKTQSQQVPTTGKKNSGQKASGQVTLTLKDCQYSNVVIPSGSGLTSNSHTYITQTDVTLSSVTVGGHCNPAAFQSIYTATVSVNALNGGSDYNIGNGTALTVASSIVGASSTSAKASSDITGGTDNIIQTVTQSDVDTATQKIAAQDSAALKQQLSSQLKEAGLFPIESTFNAATPTTTTSSNVGDQATTLTVTQVVNYTMFGVKKADLKTLIDNDSKEKIDPSKQSILSEGLDKAVFRVNSATATSAQIALTTTVTAGPDIKVDPLKKQIAGKKAGQVSDMIKADPGVTDVKVHLSPFWVTSVPSKPDKVTITFQKAN